MDARPSHQRDLRRVPGLCGVLPLGRWSFAAFAVSKSLADLHRHDLHPPRRCDRAGSSDEIVLVRLLFIAGVVADRAAACDGSLARVAGAIGWRLIAIVVFSVVAKTKHLNRKQRIGTSKFDWLTPDVDRTQR